MIEPAANPATGPPGFTGRVWYAIGILFVAWVLAYIDRYALTLLVPSIKRDLLLSDTEIGILQGFAFSLFFAVAGLPIGRLVDSYNRRNIIVVGLCLWSIMTVLCGLSQNFWELFAARLGVGVGEACLAPASMSLIADCVRPDQRGRATTLVVSGSTIGGAASNYIGGLLLTWFAVTGLVVPWVGSVNDWQSVFILIGLPGLIVAPLVMMIGEPARQEKQRAEGQTRPRFSAYARLQPRLFLALYGAFACNFVAGTALAIWGPIILMRAHGLSPAEVGLLIGTVLLVIGPLATVAAGAVTDALAKRRPLDGRILLSLVLYPIMSMSMLLLAIPGMLATTIVALILIKALTNMQAAVSYAILQDVVPNQMRGQAVAIHVAIANIVGLGAGSLLVGLATDYLYHDEAMIRASVVTVGLPGALIGVVCIWRALAPYREARGALLSEQGSGA